MVAYGPCLDPVWKINILSSPEIFANNNGLVILLYNNGSIVFFFFKGLLIFLEIYARVVIDEMLSRIYAQIICE